MTDTEMIEMIQRNIMLIVATKLGKSQVTWNEVESIYSSGLYPEVNQEIDYILG